MFPVPDPIGAQPPHGEEAEREIEHGEEEVDAEGRPAVFARELAEPLRQGQRGRVGAGGGRGRGRGRLAAAVVSSGETPSGGTGTGFARLGEGLEEW